MCKLTLDFFHTLLDIRFLALAIDDRGFVFGRDNTTGTTEHFHTHVFKLESHIFGDNHASRHHCDVGENVLLALAVAWRFYRKCRKASAELVDDKRRERLALHIVRNNDELLVSGRRHLFQERENFLNARDFLIGEQNICVFVDRLHTLGVGDHVWRNVTLLKFSALDNLRLDAK